MALLARTLRRSRLCSMTSVWHWIPTATTRSSDICAGLARAEPDLPPPQGLSCMCMLEGPAMFGSCLGSGGVRAFSNRVASKSSEHIVGGIQLKPIAFQNRMESVGSNLRNINVGFPSKSQSSSLWRTSTSPEIMGNALCTKSASGLIMQTPEIRGYNFSTFSQSGSGDVPSHHPGKRLLPVNQLNFLNGKEMWYEEWVTPIVYLRKKKLYHQILTSEPERVKPLVEQFFRDLARSLVRLVARNRVRGYDISDSLHLDNLLVSPKHNAFALKKVIWSYTSKPEEFTGYQAAGRVLKEILDSVYYSGVIESLSADIGYLFDVLDRTYPDDRLNCYNAAFLNNAGRVYLSMRIDLFLRQEVWLLRKTNPYFSKPEILTTSFYCNLPYVSDIEDHYPTDSFHPEFKKLRHRSLEMREMYRVHPSQGQPELGQAQHSQPGQVQGQAQPGQPQGKGRSDYQKETGKWLVLLNRHGCMHPKRLQEETVELLHIHTPLYLPRAQEEIIYADAWKNFNMENLFPADSVEY